MTINSKQSYGEAPLAIEDGDGLGVREISVPSRLQKNKEITK